MNLYLVRHGDAISAEEDMARPLSNQGKLYIARVAHFLEKNALPVDAIYHSSKLRSEQSAQLIASAIAPSTKPTLLPSLEPENNVKALVNWIEDQGHSILLVGHLPNLELISNYLLTQDYNKQTICFLPASIGCFKRKGSFWILEWLIEPSLL